MYEIIKFSNRIKNNFEFELKNIGNMNFIGEKTGSKNKENR